jgi:hypothetical protein
MDGPRVRYALHRPFDGTPKRFVLGALPVDASVSICVRVRCPRCPRSPAPRLAVDDEERAWRGGSSPDRGCGLGQGGAVL